MNTQHALPPYAEMLGVTLEPRDGAAPLLVMPFRNEVLGRPGFLHGGAISGLLEVAAIVSLQHALAEEGGGRIKPVNVTVDFMRGGRDIPDHRPGDGYEPPKVWWNPVISPGGLMIYSGNLFPAWKGDAFIGGLSSKSLVRVDLDGQTAKKADQWPMGARIRDVEQGPDGAIWVIEDGGESLGRLIRLTPR